MEKQKFESYKDCDLLALKCRFKLYLQALFHIPVIMLEKLALAELKKGKPYLMPQINIQTSTQPSLDLVVWLLLPSLRSILIQNLHIFQLKGPSEDMILNLKDLRACKRGGEGVSISAGYLTTGTLFGMWSHSWTYTPKMKRVTRKNRVGPHRTK